MRKAAIRKGKIALLLITALLLCDVPSFSYAKSTQKELEEALEQQKELQNQIDKNEDELDNLKGKDKALKRELRKLKEQLEEVSATLADLEVQIADKEAEIAVTQAELAEARETEKWQYECMVERIQYMYVQGDIDYLELIFSISNFSDFLNCGDYFSAIAEYDRDMLTQYEETRALIEEKEALLQQDKIDLDNLYVAAEAEKNKVAGLISQASNNIDKNADLLAEAEEQQRAYEEKMKEQEADIEALRKKIAEEMALSQEAANAAWRDISEVTFAAGDRKLLANLIWCEARGESYAGKLAVGAVVINRVLSVKYANTVVGVIYQKSQFSPVGSGSLQTALTADFATADCYRAADEAMAGMTNVGTCLYFRTPIPGLTGIVIGGHVFY